MNDFNTLLTVKTEQPACLGPVVNDDCRFKHLVFDTTTVLECEYSSKNFILFLTGGSVLLNTDSYCGEFVEGNILLLPQSSFIRLEARAQTHLVSLSFDYLTNLCNSALLQLLHEHACAVSDEVCPLKMQPSLALFTETLAYCLRRKAMCPHWHKVMSQEFILLLKEFYPRKDMVGFFRPLLGEEPEFKSFVLQNYPKVDNIAGLIELSQFSRSVFFTKFKSAFGITAKQWLLRQRANRLLGKACRPGISVKELLEVCDFDSQSQLNRYVRKTFNCTPKELIEQAQKRYWVE